MQDVFLAHASRCSMCHFGLTALPAHCAFAEGAQHYGGDSALFPPFFLQLILPFLVLWVQLRLCATRHNSPGPLEEDTVGVP